MRFWPLWFQFPKRRLIFLAPKTGPFFRPRNKGEVGVTWLFLTCLCFSKRAAGQTGALACFAHARAQLRRASREGAADGLQAGRRAQVSRTPSYSNWHRCFVLFGSRLEAKNAPSSRDGLGIRWRRSYSQAVTYVGRLGLNRRAILKLRALGSSFWLVQASSSPGAYL